MGRWIQGVIRDDTVRRMEKIGRYTGKYEERNLREKK
jgi:hypothetical protein